MRQSSIATGLRYAGYGLTLLSFVYIYNVFTNSVPQHPEYTAGTYAIIVLLGCVYSLFPFVSAYIWKLTVELASRRTMTFGEAVRIYVKTNIAKYLPGGVMQYVGRNVVGVRHGWPHAHLAVGSFLELVSIIVVPVGLLAAFRISGLWTLPDSLSLQIRTVSAPWGIVTIGAMIAAAALAWWFYWISGLGVFRKLVPDYDPVVVGGALVKITLLSLASMVAYTVLFYFVASNLFGVRFRGTDFINIACSLTVAGYAGILTPGVPGGIGVKESISVILVSAYGYDKGSLVVISFLARAFSVVGDVIAFLLVVRLNDAPQET